MIQRTKLSYCGGEVRRYDLDRFLTTMFAPADRREALLALYAFNIEISKTREVTSHAKLGAIRLQWWREGIDSLFQDKPARRHLILEGLNNALNNNALSKKYFDKIIDGLSLIHI